MQVICKKKQKKTPNLGKIKKLLVKSKKKIEFLQKVKVEDEVEYEIFLFFPEEKRKENFILFPYY